MNTDLRFNFWSQKLEERLFPFEYYFREKFEGMDNMLVKEKVKKDWKLLQNILMICGYNYPNII